MVKLNTLVIGSGGREHALAYAMRHSASCGDLYCAPGNPGISHEAQLVDLDIKDHAAVIAWCNENNIQLVVIGPEQPLEHGLSDSLRNAGLLVFGPSRAAAQLEWSKSFAKDFMLRHNIPTAAYKTFKCVILSETQDPTNEMSGNVIPSEARNGVSEARNGIDDARAYVLSQPTPIVIKYDGLAAGKGVVVAQTHDEATSALESMFDGEFGEGDVVIEGFLRGREASVFAISDGERYVVLAPSQDHKRVGDGDSGPNTGGMGAYAPAPIVTPEILATVRARVIEPTLRGMKEEGTPFIGCLYCGLMIDGDEVNVVEFNTRFGDPETQVVLRVLDADLVQLFASAAKGNIDEGAVRNVASTSAVCVVMASGGYPGKTTKGEEIKGVGSRGVGSRELEEVVVFHAGTALKDGKLVTNGGRVLGVTAVGSTIDEARRRAYDACEKITFEGNIFRTDIAANT